MEFRNSDPGAVQYGNFINYYEFNDAKERIKLLPREVWNAEIGSPQPYLMLDVGCNAGNLTQLLFNFLNECLGPTNVQILGIDIDAELLKRATSANEYPANVSYANLDITDKQAFEQVKGYLRKHGRRKFDAVCCFSITMWIHLNHGDEGLKHCLHTLCDIAELLVIEPQPWKCYQTAVRRMRRAGDDFPLFTELQWRTNVVEYIQDVLENKMGRKKIFECIPTRWQRRICFYR